MQKQKTRRRANNQTDNTPEDEEKTLFVEVEALELLVKILTSKERIAALDPELAFWDEFLNPGATRSKLITYH